MEQAWSAVKSRIEELRKQGMTQAAIGKLVGVNRSVVNRWIHGGQGGQRTSFNDMINYMKGLGLDPNRFFPGHTVESGEYGYVPHVRAKLGAGFSLDTSDEIDSLLAFKKRFLQEVGPVGNLVLFDVCGTSMEPTIGDGDTVLINTSETDIRSGDIYAIRIGDEISVKRIERLPGKILVRSDNPNSHTFEVDLQEIDGQFAVIGRVKWLGRVF